MTSSSVFVAIIKKALWHHLDTDGFRGDQQHGMAGPYARTGQPFLQTTGRGRGMRDDSRFGRSGLIELTIVLRL